MDTYNLINRFKEPSSWAGIAAIAGVFGVPMGLTQTLVNAAVGICAAIAVLMPQRQNLPEVALATAPGVGAQVVALVAAVPVAEADDKRSDPQPGAGGIARPLHTGEG